MIAITDGPTLVFTADAVPAEASDQTLSDTNFPATERRNQRGSGTGRVHTDRSVSDVMTARSRQGFCAPIVTRNAILESVFLHPANAKTNVKFIRFLSPGCSPTPSFSARNPVDFRSKRGMAYFVVPYAALCYRIAGIPEYFHVFDHDRKE
ncbi:hypothetical protein [Komagataeibacter diospyri]|uniref:hypothetical protein n=1 Tax=Komagataeibacter diospyri TaxID=1932662 RepID=UPI001143E61B|nr:hypothetical protein [Komagataeibacter diospyri]